MRIGLAVCLGVALMMSAPTVIAQTSSLRVGIVVAEQAQLRAELEAGSGRAAAISKTKRGELLARQQELLDVLDGKTSASDLSEQQHRFAADTLAWIDAAVKDDDQERLVCQREKIVGSNRVTRTCRTVAQMKRDQERGNEAVVRAGESRFKHEVPLRGGD